MAPPIYFFPSTRPDQLRDGDDRLRFALLEKRGCAAAFASVKSVLAETSCFELTGRGPGGHSGTLLTLIPNGQAPVRLGYHPDFQTWIERPAGADCWVAVDKEHPPTPADLARTPRPQGYGVELGDGHTWLVPIIRSPTAGRSQLASEFLYDGDGNLVVERQAGTERLWELSGQVWDHTFDRENHPTLPAGVIVELALGALGLNYRVGKIEMSVLRLLGSVNWEAVIEAILDWPQVEEMVALQKKTEFPPPGS